MVVEYQKSLIDFLICQLSSILFLNQDFAFCTQMEPSFDFWLFLKIGSKTVSPQAWAQREDLWVFCGSGGEWGVVCHLPVTQYLFLPCSFAHALFWLGAHVQCVALPGKGCTRWWQWRLISVTQALGFQQSLVSSFQPLVQRQHLLRAALPDSVVNPNEFLSHQSDCFTTANLS